MELVTFIGVSALVIMTPGQDTVLVLRNTLFDGRRSGVVTTLGVVSGQAIWTLATSVGLTALLLASESAFVVVKLFGATYLIYLGAQALLAAARSSSVKSAGVASARHIGSSFAFRQGLISNLGNPKIAVFFTSLLPQFTPRGHTSFFGLLGLGLVFCSLTLVWLTSYSIIVAKAGDVLRRPEIRRTLEGLAGVVLLGLGARLAAETVRIGNR